jgi:outer membrane protein assembly factor BamB
MADGNKMYSLDQDSGTVNWESNPEYTIYFNSPSFNGEYVFVSDDGVTAHNVDSGNVEWRYDFDGTLYGSSTVQLTEENVINTSEFGVFAVRQGDGSEQWQFEGSGEAIPNSLNTTSDRVIYTDSSNTIYIIDSRSGEPINQISASSTVSETSVVDDILYYTDEGLTALEINSGRRICH